MVSGVPLVRVGDVLSAVGSLIQRGETGTLRRQLYCWAELIATGTGMS